jgi:PTS system mannose-specific IIA component
MTNGSTIGILVVAHGNLADGLIGAAEQILGPQRALKALTLNPTAADPKAQVKAAAADLESGGGVLALTDLFGGTPSNVAIAACSDHKMEVVTGANLPLLLRALSKREQLPLGDLARAVADYGRQQILTPNQMLEKAQA